MGNTINSSEFSPEENRRRTLRERQTGKDLKYISVIDGGSHCMIHFNDIKHPIKIVIDGNNFTGKLINFTDYHILRDKFYEKNNTLHQVQYPEEILTVLYIENYYSNKAYLATKFNMCDFEVNQNNNYFEFAICRDNEIVNLFIANTL